MYVEPNVLDQHKAENTKIFKKFAPLYDLIELVVSRVRKKAMSDLPKGARILDVACGTGTQAVALAKRRYEVVGIDLSADMLRRANAKQRGLSSLQFIERDATATGFSKNSFDVAMISFGLHDMPEAIAIAVLLEMQRVTKSNGQLYILDYGQPASPYVRKTSEFVCSLWESDHYKNFVNKGTGYFLAKAKLHAVSQQRFLLGIFELTVIKNE